MSKYRFAPEVPEVVVFIFGMLKPNDVGFIRSVLNQTTISIC